MPPLFGSSYARSDYPRMIRDEILEKYKGRKKDPIEIEKEIALETYAVRAAMFLIDGSEKGIGMFCLDWAYAQCGHLRIDTHGDNTVMQNLVKKAGFVHCGTIYVAEDNDPRLAYEKSDKTGRNPD